MLRMFSLFMFFFFLFFRSAATTNHTSEEMFMFNLIRKSSNQITIFFKGFWLINMNLSDCVERSSVKKP